MKGATSSAAGALGAVPAPAAGAQGKFLRGDATWQDPTSSCVKTSGNQTVGGTKTFSSRILSSLNPTSWVNAANGQTLINSTLVDGDFVPLWQYETTDGDSFVLAGFRTNLQIAVVTSENKATSTNTSTTVFSLTPSGNLTLGGSVTANAFNGNATSATKATQDANGNVIPSTYATKTECNNKIPKSGSAGTVSCYETVSTNTTINQSSPSSIQTSSAVSVSNGTANTCWVKVARLTASSPSVTLGSSWKWQGGSTPTLKQNCFVVCCWCGSGGIAIANNIS